MEVVFLKGTMLSVSDKSVSVNERTDIQIVLPEVSVRFGSILVFYCVQFSSDISEERVPSSAAEIIALCNAIKNSLEILKLCCR